MMRPDSQLFKKRLNVVDAHFIKPQTGLNGSNDLGQPLAEIRLRLPEGHRDFGKHVRLERS